MAASREAIELMRGFFDKLRDAIDDYNAQALTYLDGGDEEVSDELIPEVYEEPKPAPEKKPRKKGARKKAAAAKEAPERNVPQEIRSWMAERKAAGLPAVKYVRTALDELGINDATLVTVEQADDFFARIAALVEEDA